MIYTSMFVIGTHDQPADLQSTAGALLTTSQCLSGALTVAILTLVLGTAPDAGRFRIAIALTAVAAGAGSFLAARSGVGRRRRV
jgi:hypothetical protein